MIEHEQNLHKNLTRQANNTELEYILISPHSSCKFLIVITGYLDIMHHAYAMCHTIHYIQMFDPG